MISANRMNININVDPSATIDTSFRAYAEVYGVDKISGNVIPVCWISSIVDTQTDSTGMYVTLQLDLNWLSLAHAQPPIMLQNVIIQESNTFIPVATMNKIAVNIDDFTTKSAIFYSNKKVIEITKEMRQGVAPVFNNTDAVNGAIVLVHGYCSTENPWSPNSNEFTNPYFFLNPSASITNDEFSQLVLQFVEDNNLGSFSIVGHSQGGSVGAHISNYYFSGLDSASGGRLIQSVGTPYKGSTAAGSAANLGESFGIGCGDNFDLSLDGAVLWIAGISSDSRKDIHYYTTSYKQGFLFGDYCSLPMNMILEWPNDGTSELAFTDIDGGNDQGNTQGECHITGMKYTAQYYDNDRNRAINALAAR